MTTTEKIVRVVRSVRDPIFPSEEIVRFTALDGDGNPIGKAVVENYTDRSSMLDWIYVDDAERGKKVSNALMAAVVKEIDGKGNIGVLSMVGYGEEIGRLSHLYKKFGFKPCADVECFDNKDVDGVVRSFCKQPFVRYNKSAVEGDPEFDGVVSSFCKKTARVKK